MLARITVPDGRKTVWIWVGKQLNNPLYPFFNAGLNNFPCAGALSKYKKEKDQFYTLSVTHKNGRTAFRFVRLAVRLVFFYL